MKSPLLLISLFCALVTIGFAQKPAKSDALAPIEDQPGLPLRSCKTCGLVNAVLPFFQ